MTKIERRKKISILVDTSFWRSLYGGNFLRSPAMTSTDILPVGTGPIFVIRRKQVKGIVWLAVRYRRWSTIAAQNAA